MSKYGQFCPVAKTLEVLGDRWTLLIVRDMMFEQVTQFNELQRGLPGISRSVLARRLRELQQAGVIEKRVNDSGRQSTEYHLTAAGMELQNILIDMIVWGEAWAFGEPREEELDPALLMWWTRNDVQKDRLPQQRVVVQYNFQHGKRRGFFWLVMTSADVTLCLTDPGYEVDVMVSADLATFYKLWWGHISYDEAIRDHGVTVEGLPRMVRAFPGWFAWNKANGMRRARAERQSQSATA